MNRKRSAVTIDDTTARVDWYEAPTLQEMVGAVEEIVQSSRFHPDLQLLMVDHGTDFNIHPKQIRETVGALVPHIKRFKSAAYSVQTDNHFGIASQLRVHFLMAGVAVEVFKREA